jgi:hypothetical protein
MSRNLETCARRVHELHRASDVRSGLSRARIPIWDELPEAAISALISHSPGS